MATTAHVPDRVVARTSWAFSAAVVVALRRPHLRWCNGGDGIVINVLLPVSINRVATWQDVCGLAQRLPDARLGEAHEGSPAWYAGRHQFARLRWDDDGRELLQIWTGDMDTEAMLTDRRNVFPVVHTFRYRVTAWCYLDQIDLREAAELLLDSYGIRGGPNRRAAVDPSNFLPS